MKEFRIDEEELRNIIRMHIYDVIEGLNWFQEIKQRLEASILRYQMDIAEDRKHVSIRMDKIEQMFLDFMYSINHGGVLIQVPPEKDEGEGIENEM